MKALLAIAVLAACSKAPPDPNAHAATSQASTASSGPVRSTPPAKTEPPRPAELTHVTIKALGMYCEESCPLKVRYALADLTSVYELGFDVSTESIFVSYDATLGAPNQVTKPMIAAIKGAGFDPWLAKEAWPEDARTQVVLR